ncbi:MAG: chloride channel protein [Rhodospirillales bacterium 69-11]|nr:chloride channel protein [Rhodospirillales bacterium]OJW33206.1 MAG: chloride channel protein [Rhodospirillales bacterium 69-11]
MKPPWISHAQRRRLRRMPMTSPRQWMRRVVVWIGCISVSLVAIAFAMLANAASDLFLQVQAPRPWIALIICPVGLVASFLLTRHFFPGAQGSGIPQVIATQHIEDRNLIARILSPRIAAGKIALTLLGLASGASIGREGPTVQVGACIMHVVARMLRLPRPELERALVLAGGAAGVAAAFNTPIAGVVFAIEELSHAFESRTSGTVITGVVLAGITTAALMGNYTYFGHTSAELDFGIGWVAVLMCSLMGGIGGGLFSATLIRAADGLPGRAGRLLMRHPVAFAALCGLSIAVIGIISGGTTYGTGYEQARAMVEGTADMGPAYVVLKFAATVVSYVSGIPGGLFAPSLAVGAGLGDWMARLLPAAAPGAVVLLGMVAYFSGVVQAPITATVIVMEMTDNQRVTVPLLATAFIAFVISRMICRRPLYGALARRFLAAQLRESPPLPADEKP